MELLHQTDDHMDHTVFTSETTAIIAASVRYVSAFDPGEDCIQASADYMTRLGLEPPTPLTGNVDESQGCLRPIFMKARSRQDAGLGSTDGRWHRPSATIRSQVGENKRCMAMNHSIRDNNVDRPDLGRMLVSSGECGQATHSSPRAHPRPASTCMRAGWAVAGAESNACWWNWSCTRLRTK